ncbi:MAG TPA: hypothetical protein VGW38_11825 [Chloroflexota bacterium]|nr:hypothetical protein [Chloroflexota bacterium]
MPGRVELGTVAGVDHVDGRLWLIHLDLPEIALQLGPGQCVLVRCVDPEIPAVDPFLPRAFFVLAVDARGGRLSLLVRERGRGGSWLAHRREGDHVLVHGPIGRAISPSKLSRHLLLLADGTIAVASLALLAEQSARRRLAVTLVENVEAAGGGLPPHLLRPDVEHRATSPEAGGLLGALPSLLPWADEVFVAAAPPLLGTLAALRRSRLAPFTLYANLPVQALPVPAPELSGGDFLPCGTGVCGVCAIATRSGPRLYCHEGPAFPLETLRFEPDEPEAVEAE